MRNGVCFSGVTYWFINNYNLLIDLKLSLGDSLSDDSW